MVTVKDGLDLLETRVNKLLEELERLRQVNRKLFTQIQVGSSDEISALKRENESLKEERELLKAKINQMLEQLKGV
ncbi:MAG: cell division protein ZapB [bacterium]